MKKVVGFIGLGIMGLPQACNLLKGGIEVVGYDTNPTSVEKFVAAGGKSASTIAELTKQSDIVFTMLPDIPQVKEVALGAGGVMENAKPNLIFIDMSSVAPAGSREVHDALAKKGIRMLDAPVSGGEPKAIDGTLSIMVGGDKAVFDEAYDYIKPMAGTVTLIGAIGAGNICKLANQIIVAMNIATLAEALTFAKKAGADPALVYEAIRGGLAGSTIMDAKAPMMLAGDVTPGGFLRYHIKDLNNTLTTAKESNMPIPFTAMVSQIMQACVSDGHELSDHSCLVRYFEKIANVKVCD